MNSLATLKRAMLVGGIATVVMTAYSVIGQQLRLPHADFQGLIAAHLPAGAVGSWIIYFGIGVFFAYLYRNFFRDRLPAHGFMRGVIYAFFLWMVMGFMVMPMMGMGLFSGSLHAAAGALFAMCAYGATVGYFYREH